jgi:hypothetical protein
MRRALGSYGSRTKEPLPCDEPRRIGVFPKEIGEKGAVTNAIRNGAVKGIMAVVDV